MTRYPIYFLLIWFSLASCKKESNDIQNPSYIPAQCSSTDEAKTASIGNNIVARVDELKIDILRNGNILLLKRDSVFVYDENLQFIKSIYTPEATAVVGLSDNSFITIRQEQTEKTFIHDTTEYAAWWQRYIGDDCKPVVVFDQQEIFRYEYDAYTYINRFDIQGNTLFSISLEGVPSYLEEQIFFENNGSLYFTLMYQEEVKHTLLTDAQGVFKDTMLLNSDEAQMKLFKVGFDGSVQSVKIIKDLQAIYPGSASLSMSAKTDVGFLYSSGYEILHVGYDGNVLSRRPNPNGQCGEYIWTMAGTSKGMYALSNTGLSRRMFFYGHDGTLLNLSVPWDDAYIVDEESEKIYLSTSDKIFLYDEAFKVVWDNSSSGLSLNEQTVRRGCEGSFYAVGEKKVAGVTSYYLIKIDSQGQMIF